MSARELAEYQAAQKAFEEAEANAQRIVNEVRAALGKPPDFLSDWKNAIPIINGEPIGNAVWMPAQPRIDVTGWPMDQQLWSALDQWHTARIVLENAWHLLPASEKQRLPLGSSPT